MNGVYQEPRLSVEDEERASRQLPSAPDERLKLTGIDAIPGSRETGYSGRARMMERPRYGRHGEGWQRRDIHALRQPRAIVLG
ncbi:MAG: hypothetical protein OHK0018_05730 [Erythrobacter tepidarius]